MKLLHLIPLATLSLALPEAFTTRGAPIGCSTCIPFPDQNQCDPTTSCVPFTPHTGYNPMPLYCACRAGYKADPQVVGADPSAQWRLPWAGQEGRVFVRPGLECNTLCDHPELGKESCQEVWLNTNPACQ